MTRKNFLTVWHFSLTASVIALGATGCAKDALNRALFSMGEQAQCAQANDHRIDGRQQHASCIADAIQGSDFNEYSKAREQHLTE